MFTSFCIYECSIRTWVLSNVPVTRRIDAPRPPWVSWPPRFEACHASKRRLPPTANRPASLTKAIDVKPYVAGHIEFSSRVAQQPLLQGQSAQSQASATVVQTVEGQQADASTGVDHAAIVVVFRRCAGDLRARERAVADSRLRLHRRTRVPVTYC